MLADKDIGHDGEVGDAVAIGVALHEVVKTVGKCAQFASRVAEAVGADPVKGVHISAIDSIQTAHIDLVPPFLEIQNFIDIAGFSKDKGVVAKAASHLVIAGAAIDHVLGAAAVQIIIAFAAEQGVVFITAKQRIVAGFAVEIIFTRAGSDIVIVVAAKKRFIVAGAAQRIIAVRFDLASAAAIKGSPDHIAPLLNGGTARDKARRERRPEYQGNGGLKRPLFRQQAVQLAPRDDHVALPGVTENGPNSLIEEVGIEGAGIEEVSPFFQLQTPRMELIQLSLLLGRLLLKGRERAIAGVADDGAIKQDAGQTHHKSGESDVEKKAQTQHGTSSIFLLRFKRINSG